MNILPGGWFIKLCSGSEVRFGNYRYVGVIEDLVAGARAA